MSGCAVTVGDLSHACLCLGLRRALDADLPDGVTAALRVADNGATYTFVENFANEPREVDLGAAPRTDLLSNSTLSGKVQLPPYGVLALRG